MSLSIKSEALEHFLAGIRARDIRDSKYQAAWCMSGCMCPRVALVYVFVLLIDREKTKVTKTQLV